MKERIGTSLAGMISWAMVTPFFLRPSYRRSSSATIRPALKMPWSW